MNTTIRIQRLAIVAIMATSLSSAYAHRRPVRHAPRPAVVVKAKPAKPAPKAAHFGQRSRLAMALAYIDSNRHITPKAYAKLTGMAKRDAELELDTFARSPRSGIMLVLNGKKKIYVRA